MRVYFNFNWKQKQINSLFAISHKFNLMWAHNLQGMRSKFKMSVFFPFVCSNIPGGHFNGSIYRWIVWKWHRMTNQADSENGENVRCTLNIDPSPILSVLKIQKVFIVIIQYYISHGKKSRSTHVLVHECSFFVFVLRYVVFFSLPPSYTPPRCPVVPSSRSRRHTYCAYNFVLCEMNKHKGS